MTHQNTCSGRQYQSGFQSIDFRSYSKSNQIRMVLTLKAPLPRLRLERQMQGDEDCLNAEGMSSAVTTQMRR
jgi:hypothetical protein